jgi:hypothetical protein
MIKILYIGDVCGKPGRKALREVLPSIRQKEDIDLVVTDIENLAHGRGATEKTVREIMSYGVDVMSGGNHIWRRKDFEELLSGQYPIFRTLNYPEDIPGEGYFVADLGAKGRVLFTLLQGREFIRDNVTIDLLRPVENLLEKFKDEELAGIVMEIHAETTSEKIATSLYFDGKISAAVGTHTHVPTADERILPGGTGFITDIGMVGPMNSSLWVKPEIIHQHLKYPFGERFDIVEDGPVRFDAVILEIADRNTCKNIRRVNKVL